MSRFHSTGKDIGLSRQSSRFYKAMCQKSNAELCETLRRLDIEHHSNIARILNERYNLRTIKHDLKRFGEYDSFSESDSEEEERQNGERKKQGALPETGKKRSVCQLPCIIEEAGVIGKPKSPKVLWPSPLPPLSGLPTRPRKSSDSSLGNPTPMICRERSSTLPIGKMPGDRQRQAEFRRGLKADKVGESEGLRAGNDGIHQNRSKDDNVPKERPAVHGAWEEVKKCRYLRRRRHTSPDLYKSSWQ